MRNKFTTKELIEKRMSKEQAEEFYAQTDAEVQEILWGGKRANAGRKPKTGVVLKFQIRVSEKEKEFINYARNHNLNYDDLMQEG